MRALVLPKSKNDLDTMQRWIGHYFGHYFGHYAGFIRALVRQILWRAW